MAKIDDLLVKVQSATNEFLSELHTLYSDAKQLPPEKASISDAGLAANVSDKDKQDTIAKAKAEKDALKKEYEQYAADFEEGKETDSSKGASLLEKIRALNLTLSELKK